MFVNLFSDFFFLLCNLTQLKISSMRVLAIHFEISQNLFARLQVKSASMWKLVSFVDTSDTKELTKVKENLFPQKKFFLRQKTFRTQFINLGIVLIHLTRSSGKMHSALRTRSQWIVPWGLTAGASNVQDDPQSSIRRVGYRSSVAVNEYQVPLVNPMVKAFLQSAKYDAFEITRPSQNRLTKMIRKILRNNR